jgi:hypothetical protein
LPSVISRSHAPLGVARTSSHMCSDDVAYFCGTRHKASHGLSFGSRCLFIFSMCCNSLLQIDYIRNTEQSI